MVWSKHDFERELRRQLIEIESIRKRVPSRDEITDRLDRLEEAHLRLLRKLGEHFQTLDPAERASHAGTSRAERDVADADDAAAESSLEEFDDLSPKLPLLIGRRCLGVVAGEEGSSGDESTRGEEQGVTSAQVVLVAEAVLNVPDLNERCATCGRLIVSALMAGEAVTQHGSDWHHQACLDGSHDNHPSSILN